LADNILANTLYNLIFQNQFLLDKKILANWVNLLNSPKFSLSKILSHMVIVTQVV